MARIRSIKPDFFTSETIAELPISARLTFIGLWTHVDDNGVCQDNVRLIVAALWPLEGDPLETLRRTTEDLESLAKLGLIHRYEATGKRYLFVTSWDEHQKVSHPGKPRFPRPEIPLTSTDSPHPEGDPTPSGGSPEGVGRSSALSREQGAGLEGAGSRELPPPSAAATRAPAREEPPPLPPLVAELRDRLEAVKLRARWDKLTDPDLAEVSELVVTYGPAALVRAAQAAHIPDNPAGFASAWFGAWRALPEPKARDRPAMCEVPHHSGQVMPCSACIADAKAVDSPTERTRS